MEGGGRGGWPGGGGWSWWWERLFRLDLWAACSSAQIIFRVVSCPVFSANVKLRQFQVVCPAKIGVCISRGATCGTHVPASQSF